MTGQLIRVICACCKREFAGVVPKGGNGAELRPAATASPDRLVPACTEQRWGTSYDE